MFDTYSNIIVDLRNSITKSECEKYIFHLPIITAFKNSFFQSAETIEELKELFFKTLFVSDPDYLNINDDKDLKRVRTSIYKIINQAETSEILYKELLQYFKVIKLNFNFDPKLSYFGSIDDLISSDALFPVLIRENFRIWMYGIDFENRIQIGKKPIELLESLKFHIFLSLPCDYLYGQNKN